MTDKTSREKGSSITRVLEIIEAIAKAERPLSATDISHELEIPKASAHRLVQTLEAEGFIQTNMRGNLVPAKRLSDIALGVLASAKYKTQRRSILEKLAATIGETCGISLPDGTEMIYYDRVQANWPLQVYLPIGSRVPMYCSAGGKTYLSQLPMTKLKRVVENLPLERRARNTITDPSQLLEDILNIQKTGLAIDNEEFVDGMVACSVAINVNDKFHASLFCHAPVIRKSLEEIQQLAPVLKQAASEITHLLEEEDSWDIDQ